MSFWKSLFKFLLARPRLFVFFLLLAVVEVLLLSFLYVLPFSPAAHLLGPFVRVFSGEAALHFPGHLTWTLATFNGFRVLIVLLLGSVLTGALSHGAGLNKPPGPSLRAAFSVYFSLLVFSLLSYTGGRLLPSWIALFIQALSADFGWTSLVNLIDKALPAAEILSVVFFESLLLTAAPALMIRRDSIGKSLLSSFRIFRRRFGLCVSLISLSVLVYMAATLTARAAGKMVIDEFPEIVLAGPLISIGISWVLNTFVVAGGVLLFQRETSAK